MMHLFFSILVIEYSSLKQVLLISRLFHLLANNELVIYIKKATVEKNSKFYLVTTGQMTLKIFQTYNAFHCNESLFGNYT